MNRNIHIFYRTYNAKENYSIRPPWFSYERCFINLLDTIYGYSNIKLHVMCDESSGSEASIIKHSPTIINKIHAGSDFKSFQLTCEYIKTLNLEENDLIYFLENDYLHVYGWQDKVFDLYNSFSGVDYVSLYDHADKYSSMYIGLQSIIMTTDSHHWRSTPSTCGSFILTKKLFDEDYDTLHDMQGDHNKFLWLNHNKSRTILSPIPGLSTHCMNGLLSPCINWKEISK